MRDSAALRVSIALGAFVLLSGQDCGGDTATSPGTPSPEGCNGNIQTIRITPGQEASILRCGSTDPLKTYLDATSAEIVTPDYPAWLKAELKPELVIKADVTAGTRETADIELAVVDGGRTDQLKVHVEIVDFHLALTPSSGLTSTTLGGGPVLVAKSNVPFSLQAKVYAPLAEGYRYTWTRRDISGSNVEPLRAESQLSDALWPNGTYEIQVSATNDDPEAKQLVPASVTIVVTNSVALGSIVKMTDCPASLNPAPFTHQQCARAPDTNAADTRNHAVCVKVDYAWVGNTPAPLVSIDFSARSSIGALQFGSSIRSERLHGADMVSFCQYRDEVVTITAELDFGAAGGASIVGLFGP